MTLFRTLILIIITLLLAACSLWAGTITIYNTGVDGSGLRADTLADLHYTLVSSPDSCCAVPSQAHVPDGTTYPLNGIWISEGPNSKWIQPDVAHQSGYVTSWEIPYVYATTFDLTGFIASTAVLAGQWSADDALTPEGYDTGHGPHYSEIFLNGVATGQIIDSAQKYEGWTPFTISSGFVPGVNTLELHVYNDGGPTGVRLEIAGTADVPVPEPNTALLCLFGLAAVGLLYRLQK